MKKLIIFIFCLLILTQVTYAEHNDQIPTFMNPEITGGNLSIKEEITIDNINNVIHVILHTDQVNTDRVAFLPYFGTNITKDPVIIKSDYLIKSEQKKIPVELLLIDTRNVNPTSYKELRLNAIEDKYKPEHFSTSDKIYEYEIIKQKASSMPLRINAPKNTKFYLSMDNVLAPISSTTYRMDNMLNPTAKIYSTKPLTFQDKNRNPLTFKRKETTMEKLVQQILSNVVETDDLVQTYQSYQSYLYNTILFQLDQEIIQEEFVHYFENLTNNHDIQSLIKFTIPKNTKTTELTIPLYEEYQNNRSILLNQTYFGTIGKLKLTIIPSKEYSYINNSNIPFTKDHHKFVASIDNPTMDQIEYRYAPGHTVMNTSRFFILLSSAFLGFIIVVILVLYLRKKKRKIKY